MTDAPQKLARPLANRTKKLAAPATEVAESIGMNDQLLEALTTGATAALDAGKTKYTDRPGIEGLRKWVSKHLARRFGVAYDPNAVTITCGGTEARFVAIKYFCAGGTHLICPGEPLKVAGAANLVGAPMHQKVTDTEKVGALYISAHDTGTGIDTLLAEAVAHGWPIIYEPYYGSPTHHPSSDPALRPLTVSLGDLEPRIPGWRIGWMAGHKDHARLRAFKQSMTICSPSVSQWAALAMLEAQQP